MSIRRHIICVPFIGAGHAINMFNVAHVLATPETPVHVLVLSIRNGQKWRKATGQVENPNMSIEALEDGKWEDWHTEDPKSLFAMIQGPEFTAAVEKKLKQTQHDDPTGTNAAVIINPMMLPLFRLAKSYGMKGFSLTPVPHYMIRLGQANVAEDGDNKHTKVQFKGIGGSDRDMEAELGDAIDMFGPMWSASVVPGYELADGIIYSNTNAGLEGEEWWQPHMKDNGLKNVPKYMIGPLLPPWLEYGLDQPELLRKLRDTSADDECIKFLDRSREKSVVYVGLGSHATFTKDQAKLVIGLLRKQNVKWILVFRQDTDEMRELLGGPSDDGVVTAWAPQIEALVHPAIKCVLSHGGFGTMIEGVFAGQPFITAPVMSDQFLDTRVMKLLGICVGSIAENHYLGVTQREALTPFLPDDGGESIDKLFTAIFSTPEGEQALERGRQASRALRKRMLQEKQSRGANALDTLRQTIINVIV